MTLADSALPGWSRMQELLAEAGRPIAEFRAHYMVQNSRATGMDAQETVDAIRRWRDAGGTHASVVTMGLGLDTVDKHIDQLADVRRRLEAVGLSG